MRRLETCLLIASISLLALLALAAPALASNDGRGFYGATNDKVVTMAGFVIIIFFPLLALVLTLWQSRLEKRKDARKAAEKARAGDPRWRGGW